MPGSVLVSWPTERDVFIDNKRCGTTNAPFDVEIGRHDIDLGGPADYMPPTRKIIVRAVHSPLAPLRVTFTPVEGSSE
ncbi:MAG TPA: hypothetical protein VE974_29015 [Thermoanaerobaculia bacterium]|nr:hypothetical protein [Thermoanaerobaculia bacterium]